jgi:hypothetical protein
MNFHKMFAKLVIERKPNEELFDEIIGCEDTVNLCIYLFQARPLQLKLYSYNHR